MSTQSIPDGAIRFHHVTKSFAHHAGPKLLRDRIGDMFSRSPHGRFVALKDVSFDLAPGESLGLVGSNGAGKSTLLNLATGLLQTDSGTIEIGGRVGALLELGAGFHYDLTGAENLRIHASLLGLSRRETNEKFEQIVDFSGIREFIDEPLRTYSGGMILRLAFSVAVNAAPQVLLIDELIGVGDQDFQERAHQKILELRRAGRTMMIASHASSLLESLCDRALWLDHGRVRMLGPVQDVLEAYRSGRAQS